MLAAQAASGRHALQPLPCSGPAGQRSDRPWRQQAAGDGRGQPVRCRRRRAGTVTARAAADFQQLRSTAQDSVAAAQAKLSALEAAQRTAAQAREPAAEAERHWQDLHSRLTALTHEAQEATKSLRTAVTAAAGGEAEATHALLQVHMKERLDGYKSTHGLSLASEWKLYPVQDLPLHSIPGGRMLYQLAAAEVEGQPFAIVAVGISNPFMFDNLRSLLMHWGVSEGLNGQWGQPPRGWHTSPGVSTPAGDRAWDTVLGAFAPVMRGEAVTDAAVYSVVLQIPLEGALEVKGGIKCVLRRTDHGQPEWIKAGQHNNADFFLDFQPAVAFFRRKRRAAQKAAIAAARTAAKAAGGRGRGRSSSRSPNPPRSKKGRKKDWASLMSWDESDTDDDWGPELELPVSASKAAALAAPSNKKVQVVQEESDDEESDDEEPEVLRSAEIDDHLLPTWVTKVDQFVQLSDLPQERSQASHLKCLGHVAAAIAQTGGDRQLTDRVRQLEGLLQQVDLLELSSRAAQQEKEQLQAMLKQAQDESSHLLHEIGNVADSARRTAVKLRGRETEVTQRDLEAVAQQVADELLRKASGGGSFWHNPFAKEEERQLVFVQQKVMDLTGLDAQLVVQVFVEGTRVAVEAAAAAASTSANGNGAVNGASKIDAAFVANSLAASSAAEAAAAAAAAAEAAETNGAAGKKKGGRKATKKKEEKEKEKPGFDHVVLGVAVAEKFPDGRLKTPLILHLGCVAHQSAKWQAPPEQWLANPSSVSVSVHGSASQIPLQRYSIAAEDGGPVFVDPALFGLAIRLPLKECLQQGIGGVEFVLKTFDGQWLSWEQGHHSSNFYMDLPLRIKLLVVVLRNMKALVLCLALISAAMLGPADAARRGVVEAYQQPHGRRLQDALIPGLAAAAAPAAAGKTVPPSADVQKLTSLICSDPEAAGDQIRTTVQNGGADAQTAVFALFAADCKDEEATSDAFAIIDAVNTGDPADIDTVSSWFTNFVEAADAVAIPVCLSLAVVDSDTGRASDQRFFHACHNVN
ncbi:Pyruvate phosphate dikinase,PEP pyruvate-binding [Chlorella sorokiniana]|uniref:Pyruvate phosphate dikinase,PEP pyruvate-binding n=1 Tax=Chlorella sorokiniana TaxID=3076 RepID=A0A2P6TY20_CHLSO|nr:Pyruvate phosphate dikinase,PEP pyruvate-binding [Chlorella sorokiniana]|eukprot:PRW58962.1 Pyruvate phosphate dikinase,PEP pyruvate-binding [Chlorella sorokiniana]